MPQLDHAEPADDRDDRDEDDEDPVANFRATVSDDWARVAQGMRQRKKNQNLDGGDDGHGDVDDDFLRDEKQPMCGRRCCLYFASFVLAFAIVGGYQLWKWFNPEPVSCSLELIRPQKFKVDVTEFFAPRVSAAIQLVLSVKNANMLRAMLLEQCKVTAYDDETGLKLGTAQQNSLVLQPFSTTQVTVTLNQLGGGLPVEEQRSLAATFLSKKALLLTIVATASSRLPKKGSIASALSNNASRRVEWPSSITKEPFFQRAHAPPAPEPEASPAGKPNKDEA